MAVPTLPVRLQMLGRVITEGRLEGKVGSKERRKEGKKERTEAVNVVEAVGEAVEAAVKAGVVENGAAIRKLHFYHHNFRMNCRNHGGHEKSYRSTIPLFRCCLSSASPKTQSVTLLNLTNSTHKKTDSEIPNQLRDRPQKARSQKVSAKHNPNLSLITHSHTHYDSNFNEFIGKIPNRLPDRDIPHKFDQSNPDPSALSTEH
jgi:hypothetical protein